MNLHLDVSAPLWVLLTAFGTGVAFSIIPLGTAEAAAIAIGALRPESLIVPALLVYTTGHVLGKAGWYWAGTLSDRVGHARVREWILRGRTFLASRPHFGVATFALSALLSVPPFHLTAIAAGMVRIPVWLVATIAFGGRLVRFGVFAGLPWFLAHI